MGRRDDMKAALECRQPEGAVPRMELDFHPWDAASGRHIVFGREFEALSDARKRSALSSNADIMLQVAEEFCLSALRTPGNYWEVAPGEPAYSWLPGDWRWEQLRAVRERKPDDLMLIGPTGGVISPPSQGFVEWCYKLFDAPEEIDRWARDTLAGGIANARRMREEGVEIVGTSSDVADNHGPFFKPEQMARFVLPYLREWAAAVRGMGLYCYMHTDGDVNPVLDDLADSGIHALQAIDPVAGMDIADVKRRVGDRVCLCGNIDCGLLVLGPPEAVYESTRQVLADCKPGGGLVLGASNAVFRQTPIEHYRAMHQAWLDHGPYGG